MTAAVDAAPVQQQQQQHCVFTYSVQRCTLQPAAAAKAGPSMQPPTHPGQ